MVFRGYSMNVRVRMLVVAAAIVGIVGSVSSMAQQRLTLTVDESVRMGLQNSKQLHSSRMAVQAADAMVSEVEANGLPSLKFVGAYTRLSDVPAATFSLPFSLPGTASSFELSPQVLNNYVLRLSLQQPLFTGFRLQNSAKAAEYSVRAAESHVTATTVEQSFAIKTAYWNLFKVRQVQKLLEENVEQVKAHLQNVKSLAGQGMAHTNDVLKVQVQLSDVEFRLLDVKNNTRLAMVALNNLLGVALTTEIELSSEVSSPVEELPELANSIDKAAAARPDITAMEHNVQAAKASVDAAKGGWYPQVLLTANYNYNRPNQRIFPTKDEFKDTWDIGVGVSFDVWNWQTTSHQTAQAEAKMMQAQDGLALMRDGIAVEVTQKWLTLQQTRERIAVAQVGVEQAEENYRITRESYKQGAALNTDVIDAQTALLQSKTNYITALVDCEIARVGLQKAMGEQ